jgi:20S proteasome alpha/beta subunit
MTVCVAAICDNGKTIILVSDKMIGTGFIESEPDINKLLTLHKDWWALIAADDISPIFDIIDYAKGAIREKKRAAALASDSPLSLQDAMDVIREAYEKKRMEQAESLYLKPIGWDIASFNASAGGPNCLPDFGEIKARIADYSLDIELLVAGFSEGTGYLFSLIGREGSIINRHDIPGFYAIGSGGIGAIYMMYYRDMSYKKLTREAVYYAMEAKLFGEQASGVGEKTNLYIATADGKFTPLGENTIEKKLISVWNKLRPKWIGKESRAILNSLTELPGFEEIKEEKKEKEKDKESEKGETPSS